MFVCIPAGMGSVPAPGKTMPKPDEEERYEQLFSDAFPDAIYSAVGIDA